MYFNNKVLYNKMNIKCCFLFFSLSFVLLLSSQLFTIFKIEASEMIKEDKHPFVYPIDPSNVNNDSSQKDSKIDPKDIGKTKSLIAQRVLNDLSHLTPSEVKDYPLSDLSVEDLEDVLKGLSSSNLAKILSSISNEQLNNIKSKLPSDIFTEILDKLEEDVRTEVTDRLIL
jgi:hypothetical protein